MAQKPNAVFVRGTMKFTKSINEVQYFLIRGVSMEQNWSADLNVVICELQIQILTRFFFLYIWNPV